MTDSDDMSPAEMRRCFARIESGMEKLAAQVHALDGLHQWVRQIDKHLENTDDRVERLTERVGKVQLYAAYISGAVAGLVAAINWLMGRH